MRENLTPNNFLDSLPVPVIMEKPAVDQQLLASTLSDTPLKKGAIKVIGRGDWNRDRSSGGSVVIEMPQDGDFVAKIPLGKLSEDGWEQARKTKAAIDSLAEVSPPTLVVLSGTTKETARPLILQNKIKGTPVCESPLRTILTRPVLRDIKLICKQMRAGQKITQASDLFGQRIRRPWSFLVNSIFLFSDNIVIANNRAILVDNAPYRTTNPFKQKIHWLRLAVTESAIGVFLKKLKY